MQQQGSRSSIPGCPAPRQSNSPASRARWGLSLGLAALLGGCGGGGSEAPPPPPAPPPPAVMAVSGTAARGAALAGAQISLRCASGSGAASAGSDGRYTLSLSGATLPCALRATASDGMVLHSVLPGSGSASGSATVNASPLTELLVAGLAGSQASAGYFDTFGAGSTLSAGQLAQALEGLRTLLGSRLDLGALNPVSDSLVAASGGGQGNAHDQTLDALGSLLTRAGTSVAALSTALSTHGGTPAVVAGLLSPVASDCPALRSGRYRLINPRETDAPWRAHVAEFDAATRVLTLFNGQQVSLPQADASAPCSYLLGEERLMVSSGGLWFLSNPEAGGRSLTFGLPEHSLPLSELVGTWNLLWTGLDTIAGQPGRYTVPNELTLDASGQVTQARTCLHLEPCVDEAPGDLRVRAAASGGGFEVLEGGAVVGQLYLTKNAAGGVMLVGLNNEGEDWIIGTKKRALSELPALGTSWRQWEFGQSGSDAVSAPRLEGLTVSAVDTAAQRVTLRRESTVSSINGRLEPNEFNQPREGWRLRRHTACTLGGGALLCPQLISLPLPGLGATLTQSTTSTSGGPANSFLSIGVEAPAAP